MREAKGWDCYIVVPMMSVIVKHIQNTAASLRVDYSGCRRYRPAVPELSGNGRYLSATDNESSTDHMITPRITERKKRKKKTIE